MSDEIRVLLVDDHAMLRRGMALLLREEADMAVVGEAGDGEAAIAQTLALKPDVLVMDISMPKLNGIDATQKILAECPDSKIIALSIHSSKHFVDGMLNAGAAGYLLKESLPEELIQSIRAVMRGEMYLSSAITSTVVLGYVESMPGELAVDSPAVDVGIIQTKLHPPPIPPDLVLRPRLLERLDTGRVRPLILVSAGAGYGKCVLIRSWLDTCDWPNAWVSLDERDNDLRQFLRYLVAAVHTMFPGKCEQTLGLIQTPRLPTLPILLATLSNELGTIDKPFILVLDNYHHIGAGSPVHDLIQQLLAHPPIPMHLAILTRRDPPLELVTLRGHGQITEIRTQDLSFDQSEARAFLEKSASFTVSDEAMSNLQQQVEGWVVGLRLVSLALQEVEKPNEFLKDLHGGIQQTREFLIEEVIAQRSPQLKEWLLATSILDRFCPELCNAVCSVEDSDGGVEFDGNEFIAELLINNLFTIPLDNQGAWFRYHNLFQELLSEQLRRTNSADEIAALHSRASQWFESQDLIDEAFDHALAMEDVERAAQLVERHARAVMNNDKWYIVEKWLSKLPEAVVQERPELLLASALMYFFNMEPAAIPPVLDRIDQLMGGDPKTHDLSGEVATFRGFLSFYQGDIARTLTYLKHAMDRVHVADIQYRRIAEVHFLIARQMEGQREQVTEIAAEWLTPRSTLKPQSESILLFGLAYIHYLDGDLAGAARYIARKRNIAKVHGLANAVAWCDYLEGLSCLRRGKLDEAIQFLEDTRDKGNFHVRRTTIDAMGALALAYQARQEPDRADQTMRALDQFANNLGTLFQPLADSYAVRLALMQERPEVAVRWLKARAPPPAETLLIWLEAPFVTRCRALIAVGSTAALRETEKKLQEYAEKNEAQHNFLQLIGIVVLQAIACEKQGKARQAAFHLKRALTLGRPSGFIFPFTELGQTMRDMLRNLPETDANVEFVKQILLAFENADNKVAVAVRPIPSGKQPSEPLTNRELDILALLAQHLQNKEIAARLFVSSETVKTHLKHLFQKLAVTNRRDAAAKAVETISSYEQDLTQP